MDNLYFFEGLSKKEIAHFLLIAEVKKFKKGSIIIKEGDKSDNKAYIIKSGSVDVFKDGEQLATLKSGDIFGELALIISEIRIATIVAAEDSEVFTFAKEDFISLCKKSGKYEEIKRKILARIKDNFYRADS